MKVLLGIPAYNCEKQIIRVLDELNTELVGKLEKIVIVDNRSTDHTAEVALQTIKNAGRTKFEVWRNNSNYSLGGTHKVIFLAAERYNCDYIAIIHGDDQAKASELNKLLELAQKNPEYDAILGSRFMKESKLVGYDWKRIWGNKVLNLLYTIISGQKTLDLGSGLNLFKVSTLKDREYLGFGDNMTFNLDLLLHYYSKLSKLRYVPITWREEDQVTNARNFKIARTAISLLFKWRFGLLNYPFRRPEDYPSTKLGPK